MRKIIYTINMSIDGYVDHTKFSPDEEVFNYFVDLVHEVDLIAYGRKMYDLMFPYWTEEANRNTKAEHDFAQRITAIDKIIFSRWLASAQYNTQIVRTDPVAELLRLKQTDGKSISLSTVSMLPHLAQAGVIDEYRLVVHPGMLGQGARLVKDGSLLEKLDLNLISTRTFKSGCIALHYVPQEQ